MSLSFGGGGGGGSCIRCCLGGSWGIPPKKTFAILGPSRLIFMQSERSHQELHFLNIKKFGRKLECL